MSFPLRKKKVKQLLEQANRYAKEKEEAVRKARFAKPSSAFAKYTSQEVARCFWEGYKAACKDILDGAEHVYRTDVYERIGN